MGAVAAWQSLVGVVLVLGSSFFSGTETALTALGDARARQVVEMGGRRARLLRLWVEHPERVLSTLLVGNTLVNIGAGAIAGDVASSVAVARRSARRPGAAPRRRGLRCRCCAALSRMQPPLCG